METKNWDNMKSCCDDMKSCSCTNENVEDKGENGKTMKDVIGKCMGVMKEKMKEDSKHGMNRIKLFLLFPGLILLSAFLLTYFLNPEVVQVLWLVITGILIGLGLLFILMINILFKRIRKHIIA